MPDHRISHFWKISEERRFWLWLSEKGGQSFIQNGLLFDLVDKRRRGKNWGYLFESRIPSVCKIKSSAAIKFALLLKLLFFFSVGGGRGANFSFHILSKIVATFIAFANDKFGFAVPTGCDSATSHSLFFQHAWTLHLFAETTRTMWLTLAALSGDQR